MAGSIRFAFVCQQRWKDLLGDDPVKRFCPDCSRDVIHLDLMSDAEREQLFREASSSGNTPCVFATVPVENTSSCKSVAVPVDGMLARPEPEGAESEEELEFPMFQELGGEPILDDDYSLDTSDVDDDSDIEIKLDEIE